MRFSRIRIFYVFQLEKEKTGERKHLLEKRVPFPCSASTARPIHSSPKPPNIIEYLLAVSGKMKNHRKAIALEPLWQLHKKSSRNIPGTFFHNRNSCRITSPPVNILRVGVRGRELFTKSSLPRYPPRLTCCAGRRFLQDIRGAHRSRIRWPCRHIRRPCRNRPFQNTRGTDCSTRARIRAAFQWPFR